MFLIHEGIIEPVELVHRRRPLVGYNEYVSPFSGQVLLYTVRSMESVLGFRYEAREV